VREDNSTVVRTDPLRKQLLKFSSWAVVYTRVQEKSKNLGRMFKNKYNSRKWSTYYTRWKMAGKVPK